VTPVRWRRSLLAAVALVAAAGALWLVSRLAFFRVRQIELEGVRYLAPEQIIAGLDLAPRQSLFTRLGPIERRLENIAGVVEARVSRRMPATLRVSVTELLPIALAPGPAGLVALDGEGRPLPYDPAATGMDLPVVRSSDRDLVAALERVRAADSVFYGDIETITRGPPGSVILELGERGVMVPVVPTSQDIRAVAAVRRHLAATARPYAELDARYGGWVVVRRDRS
jgi:hypothetical protein